MYKNIAFIGGIHGVGKTTVCEHVCGKLNFRQLSASKIIKWEQIKEHLEARDQRLYDYDILSRLQEAELSRAQYISDELGVKLCLGTRSDFSAILNTLKQFRHESTTGH